MTLQFTTMDVFGLVSKHVFDFRTLEEVADFLNKLVQTRDYLIEAKILDNQQTITLPVEVFDGEDFSWPFQQVESQWQKILISPQKKISRSVRWRIDIIQKRIKMNQCCIQQTNRMIRQLRVNIEAINLTILGNVPLMNQYQRLLSCNEAYLIQLELKHTLLVHDLSRLNAC